MTTQAETTASRACIGMSGIIALSMAVSVSAQVQLHELPLTVPTPCSARGSLLSGNGAAVVGLLDNGMAGLWRLGGELSEMGAFCPTAVNHHGNVACGVDASGMTSYVYTNGQIQQLMPPDGQVFRAEAIDASWQVSGSLSGTAIGTRAAFYDGHNFQLIPGIPEDEHPSALNSSIRQDSWSTFAGILQGWSGKFGFVHWRTFNNPSATVVLRGPDGSQSWVNDLGRYGNRAVGQVPLPGELPWIAGIPNRACLWSLSSKDGGWGFSPTLLRQLPGTTRSDAFGTSEWADVIVGECASSQIGRRATAWVGDNRPVDLTRYLQCRGVTTPILETALRVSDDGTKILARAGMRLYLITGFTPPPGPITDLNWDGNTDGIDLGLLLSAWGPCASPCDADLNRDGAVDGNDLAELLAKWGSCP